MFRELCGEQGLKNVVLTSTFWDSTSRAEGERRQKELETSPQFWSRMIQKGCKTARLDGKQNSCFKILEDIARNNGKITMQIQQEVVVEGKAIRDTIAARETFSRLQRVMQEQSKRDAEKLRQEQERKMKELEDRNRRERQLLAEELEQKRQEELSRRRRAAERTRRDEEAAKARELAAQQRRLRELKERVERLAREREEEEERQIIAAYEARQAYYKNYSCLWRSVSNRYCDKCRERLHKRYTHYFRMSRYRVLSLLHMCSC